MKTISSRFLKGGLAVLLAVIMLFSSCITGFAAVVEGADTRANVDVSTTGVSNYNWYGNVYFLAPETWDIDTYKYVQIDITRTTSATSSNYQYYAVTMTRIGNSRLFYAWLSADHSSWGQTEYIAFTANSSTYNSSTFKLNTNHYYTTPLNYGCASNNYYLFKPNSATSNSTTTNGNAMEGSYNASRNTLLRANQTVNIYTDGTQSGVGGTIKMAGYYDSGTSAITASNDTSTTSENTISYNAVQGSLMTLSVASTTEGYEFDGWYSAATGGTALSTETSYSYNVFNTKTVYARFKQKTYTVTFKDHDGTILNTQTVAHGNAATAPSTPSRTGYTFTGWDKTVGAITADTTYTAQYSINKYTITYDYDYDIADSTAQYDIKNAEITLPTPYRDGYEFTGWTYNGTTYDAGATFDASAILADITFTANWEQLAENYKISFKAQYKDDGGIYKDGALGGTVKPDYDSVEIPNGDPIQATATPEQNYRFVGWFVNGECISESAQDTFTVSKDATYIARFIREYTVSATGEDGITVTSTASGTVDAGTEVTFTASDLQSGYRFDGWYKANDLENVYNSALSFSEVVASDIELVAITTPIYTVNWTTYSNTKVASSYQSWITVSPATAAAGEPVTLTVTNKLSTTSFYGLFNGTDFGAELAYPTPAGVTDDDDHTTYTYEITMVEGGIDLYALFYEYYSGFDYDPATDIYTRTLDSVNPDGQTFTIRDHDNDDVSVSIGTSVGLTIVQNTTGSYTLDIDEVNYYADKPVVLHIAYDETAGKYVLTAIAEPKPKYNVTFADGTMGEGAGDYAVGAQVTLKISVSSAQYLTGVTISGTEVDATVDTSTATVTFAMPDGDVVVEANLGEKRKVTFTPDTGLKFENYSTVGYVPGDKVSITVEPLSDAFELVKFTSTTDGVEITKNNDGTFTVTIASMPDADVVIDSVVNANFLMDAQVVTVDYSTDTSATTAVGGTVTMAIGENTITKDDYVEQGTTVTYTAAVNDDYTFIGFFSNADCTKLLSTKLTYDVVPTDNTTIYVLFVRNYYITGSVSTAWDTFELMSYDYKEKAYYYDTDVTTDGEYKISTTKSYDGVIVAKPNQTNTWVKYKTKGFTTTDFSEDTNKNFLYTGLESGYSAPVRIYCQPVAYYNHNHYVQATNNGATVYLSSGRLDALENNYDAITEFINPEDSGITVSALNTITSGAEGAVSETVEQYYIGTMENAHSFTIQTTLTGAAAANYYVDSYIIYYIDTQTYDVIPSTDIAVMGANRYSASVMCQGDCYIVPVYYHTDEYLQANGIKTTTIYFDATDGDRDYWGPFVACYPYGIGTGSSSKYELNGSWPGQLMIPNDDGTSYSIRIEIPADKILQGVVFNNYLQYSVPATECVAFGLGTPDTDANLASEIECVQTYDYREPYYLYIANYASITFKMKTSSDGYHGDYIDEENTTNGKDSEWPSNEDNISDLINNGSMTFEPLMNRQGTALMSFTGKTIDKSVSTAPDYYVVAKGDVEIKQGDYKYDESYAGKWSVEWWIYDNEGNYITKVLSGTMYDYDSNDDGVVTDFNNSDLVDALNDAGHTIDGEEVSFANLADKVVHISYEFNNACLDSNSTTSHSSSNDRFDGQWYGNKADETMSTQIYVGLYNAETGKYDIANDATPNEEAYGKAYINETYQTYNVPYLTPIVNLSATPIVGADGTVYKYDGLYIILDGEYKRIAESYNYSPTVTGDTTYYALFSPVGDSNLLVTHQPYANFTDTQILSHNGVSTMTVDIYAYDEAAEDFKGELLASGEESIFLTQASVPVTNGEKYVVEITTTPLNQGRFYAWYTDSVTADGDPTYEEVMTLKDDVDKTETVSSSFVYTASASSQKVVNIYSDVTRVTNKATLVYKYINRFGEERVYTHPEDITLSDDECLGYSGNNYQPYVPTYLTQYTMVKYNDDFEVEHTQPVYGDGDRETYEALGYVQDGSSNRIDKYAPSDQVTQAIDQKITWVVEDVYLTAEKSLVILEAKQEVQTFTITANIPGGKQLTETGPYNTLAEGIEAPATDEEGKEFSYWRDDTTGEILSYLIEYNYRIVEDKTITAVYGEKVAAWTPVIDSVTYTREYQDTSDYVYSDFLITFNSYEGLELDTMKAEGANVKYGLVMIRDKNYKYEGLDTTNDPVVFPDATCLEDNIETVLAEIIKTGGNVGFDGVDVDDKATRYLAYNYDLTGYESTNFNRMEYYIRYNNLVENNRKYAFTAYVYLMVENDGENKIYYSAPQNVSIYDAATAAV